LPGELSTSNGLWFVYGYSIETSDESP